MPKAGPTGGALLLLGVLCALGSRAALAADRFVSTSGTDAANDCLTSANPCRTIGHVLTQAVSGDTVKLAEGTYQESSLAISGNTTLAISGGWSSDYGMQSGSPTRTKIDAGFQGPVFDVTAAGTTLDLTLDTVTIMKGVPGVSASSTGTGVLTVSVVNSLLRNNRSGIAPRGLGANLLTLTVTDTVFRANRADDGGGIAAAGAVELIVTGSTFVANSAVGTSGAISAPFIFSVAVEDCIFRSNRASWLMAWRT